MDVQDVLDRASEAISVSRSFGPGYERDGCLVIPVAAVAGGGGGGSETKPDDKGSKTGSGAGFGSVSWPLGVYVVKDGAVRWVPTIDATRVIITAAAVVRALVAVRSHRRRAAAVR